MVFALFLFGVWPWIPGISTTHPRTIVLYGFSILGEVFNDEIFPAFQRQWELETGERIEFVSAFAGSGTVTNQIILGVPVQVAVLSLELDAIKLSEKKIVPPDSWRTLPNEGVVNRTPFVIVVRPGNPLGIKDFPDLVKPGVKIVHPDPLVSGGAQWLILAEYGSRLKTGGARSDAIAQLLGIWKNISSLSSSARAASTQFKSGFGDVLITYEQEALSDRAGGKLSGEIVYPKSTVLSEHTVVIVERNIPPNDRELVRRFAQFLWSDKAQRIFVKRGFRSVDDVINNSGSFESIEVPFTASDFGGWRQIKKEIIDGAWKGEVLPLVGIGS